MSITNGCHSSNEEKYYSLHQVITTNTVRRKKLRNLLTHNKTKSIGIISYPAVYEWKRLSLFQLSLSHTLIYFFETNRLNNHETESKSITNGYHSLNEEKYYSLYHLITTNTVRRKKLRNLLTHNKTKSIGIIRYAREYK